MGGGYRSLHYTKKTEKMAGVLLIVEKEKDQMQKFRPDLTYRLEKERVTRFDGEVGYSLSARVFTAPKLSIGLGYVSADYVDTVFLDVRFDL